MDQDDEVSSRASGKHFAVHQLTSSLRLALVGNSRHLLLDLLGVHQVVLLDEVQVAVQLVHQRHACGDVQLQNLSFGHALDVLADCPQGIAVGCHHDALAGHDAGRDGVEPEREHTVHSEGEGLCAREGRLGNMPVEGVVGRVARVADVDGGRWDVVAPPPNLDLLITMLRCSFGLVETLQTSIVAFVETPSVDDWHGEVVGFHQGRPCGSDGTSQHRCENDIELEASVLQHLACLHGLELTLLREVDISPTSEDVLDVPVALAVAEEDDLEGAAAAAGACSSACRCARRLGLLHDAQGLLAHDGAVAVRLCQVVWGDVVVAGIGRVGLTVGRQALGDADA
mmetsp:Transcript_93990/g.196095  ORF Transcript_93990/g.196095 Transcript_93990/m.196095 type:complete len:341 (+) Transcript_93990:137-1159(+)